jgi:holo-[acyl-carrier protein] synthase
MGAGIVGVGIDLIEIDRIERALERHPRFAERCFTPAEAAYCLSRRYPPQHFAARFAAKEAIGKALGIGMTRWQEAEVVRGRGAPTGILTGRCLRRAGDLGVVEVMLSLTHSRGMAAAVAILRSASPRQ